MTTAIEESESVFKIGAVSKITNIPVDTLRIWERRYSVVVPIRSKNADRLYQSSDINRLTLLKMLVDRGHSIGTIARLNNDELNKRLSKHEINNIINKDTSENLINVVVVGEVLSIQIQHSELNSKNFSLTHVYKNENDFIENNSDDSIDILVLEYPVIQDIHIDKINTLFKQSGANHLLIIYGFTNSSARKILDKTDYTYIQAPISVDNLRREVIDLIKDKDIKNDIQNEIELKQKAPGRTYSNKQLIELTTASRIIKCECPQHLSSIVIKLVQFEHYINECIERYEVDAEMHADLGNMAGHSRAILEQAIVKVIESEKLSMENDVK
jgi:DNA-binding transcriptional MerR regulator